MRTLVILGLGITQAISHVLYAELVGELKRRNMSDLHVVCVEGPPNREPLELRDVIKEIGIVHKIQLPTDRDIYMEKDKPTNNEPFYMGLKKYSRQRNNVRSHA